MQNLIRKNIPIIFSIMILLYIGSFCYCFQYQSEIFKSTTLSNQYKFKFENNFEELFFETKEDGLINALLFYSDKPKGVVCFWKGNSGTLVDWGKYASFFLQHDYDFFVADYRMHGKSTGEISKENFYKDAHELYDFLIHRYDENQVINVGYSLGTVMAAFISANYHPKRTILIDPIKEFKRNRMELVFPFPAFNRFHFRVDLDIQRSQSPVAIITGTKSHLFDDAQELVSLLTGRVDYFEIEGATHFNILDHDDLKIVLPTLLDEIKQSG